jgi:hypothetical protein
MENEFQYLIFNKKMCIKKLDPVGQLINYIYDIINNKKLSKANYIDTLKRIKKLSKANYIDTLKRIKKLSKANYIDTLKRIKKLSKANIFIISLIEI